MIKLPTILIVAALAALPFSATAAADDTPPPVCYEGYVAVGPYCVAAMFANNPLFVDPTTCPAGYFQGACLPDTLPDPVVLDEAAYTFQTPAAQPAPVDVSEAIVAPVVALWLTPAELHLGDLRSVR